MPPKLDPSAGSKGAPAQAPRHAAANDSMDDDAFFAHSDTIKILIATDTHVGYREKDPIIGEDSFNTWEEILQHAKAQKVDFILHGGDLFHENKPSRKTMFRAMESIRNHCFGDANVQIKLLSDPTINFPKQKQVNYADPNLNVAIPIFIVHGNHDDPSGDGQLSAIDLLSAGGLVNYYGRADSPDDISIHPLLFQKGQNKCAVYGLGNIRDERLYRTFRQKKVKFWRPKENVDDWYNIMVIHQNRSQHSQKNFVDESMLDSFLDLVVWGHEHESHMLPQANSIMQFSVIQPGSSVATSLCEGETAPKYIFMLEVREGKCRVNAIRLATVRPMALQTVTLSAERELHNASAMRNDELVSALNTVITRKLDALVQECADRQLAIQGPAMLPLIRLRIDYTGSGITPMPPGQIPNQYKNRVANPAELLHWISRRLTTHRAANQPDDADLKEIVGDDGVQHDEAVIDDLLEASLRSNPLTFLDSRGFHDALHKFVDKDETDAISGFVQRQIKHALHTLSKLPVADTANEDTIMEKLRQLRPPSYVAPPQTKAAAKPRKPAAQDVDEEKEAVEVKEETPRSKASAKRGRHMIDLVDDDEEEKKAKSPSKRPRKAPAKADAMDVDDDIDHEPSPPAPQSQAVKRGRSQSLDAFLVKEQPASSKVKLEPPVASQPAQPNTASLLLSQFKNTEENATQAPSQSSTQAKEAAKKWQKKKKD